MYIGDEKVADVDFTVTPDMLEEAKDCCCARARRTVATGPRRRNERQRPAKTLMKRASDSFIVNKSRFIGHGAPVESEEEALGFLAEMRREYQDASHNCYAYIIGTNIGIMRATTTMASPAARRACPSSK